MSTSASDHGGCERIKVNKYSEKCRRAGAYFQPLVLKARSVGRSKTTVKILKKDAMLAVHRTTSDPMFQHRMAGETAHQGPGAQYEPGPQRACRMVKHTTRGQVRGMQAKRAGVGACKRKQAVSALQKTNLTDFAIVATS
jgi:hypothetical protein